MYPDNINSREERLEQMDQPKKVLKGRPHYFALRNKEGETERPLYLMMNLETSCSYRCAKCALNGERETTRKAPLTLEQRKKIIKQARQIGIESLAIAGLGEPTENFALMKDIIETAKAEGLTTILFSTLNGLTLEMATFFRENDVSVIVSLDSLDPKTYRKLTGTGDLPKVLEKISMLKAVYRGSSFLLEEEKVVRLGINTTIVIENKNELDTLRNLAGEEMQFIANPPMKRGKFDNQILWKNLVGEDYAELARLAREKSETGGNSTFTEGTCGYFIRGISVDTDGQLMSCAYAGESVDVIEKNIEELTESDQLLKYYLEVRAKYYDFAKKTGPLSPCPLRHPDYREFLITLRRSR